MAQELTSCVLPFQRPPVRSSSGWPTPPSPPDRKPRLPGDRRPSRAVRDRGEPTAYKLATPTPKRQRRLPPRRLVQEQQRHRRKVSNEHRHNGPEQQPDRVAQLSKRGPGNHARESPQYLHTDEYSEPANRKCPARRVLRKLYPRGQRAIVDQRVADRCNAANPREHFPPDQNAAAGCSGHSLPRCHPRGRIKLKEEKYKGRNQQLLRRRIRSAIAP